MAEDPRQGDSAPDLVRSWTDYFRSPAVISGLLQFGATAMTPGSGGFGPALSAGAEAANRALQAQQATASAQTAAKFKQQELDVERQKAGIAEQRAQRQERRDESRLAIDQEQLGLARERLKVWEKSLSRPRSGGAGLTDDIFRGWVDFANNAAFNPDIPDELRGEIASDPIGYAMRRTQETIAGGAGSTPSSASASEEAKAGAGGADSQAGNQQGASPVFAQETASVSGSLPTQPGQIVRPETNPPVSAPAVEASGYPPFDAITDEQWAQVFSNPAVEAELAAVYGEAEIQTKKFQLRNRGLLNTGQQVSGALLRE